ncbi:MAG: CVNH domain-containing protein [Candidatus Aquilonibacter sp.]|jgi:hypothetical protein
MRIALSIITVAALALFGFSKPAPAQSMPNWPGGSWQASCRHARVSGNQFSASCQTTSGSWTRSAIGLNSCPGGQFGNNNGQLFCESGNSYSSDPGYGRWHQLPRGSWVASCDNAAMNGSVFSAECSTGNGYRSSSIDLRSCPSRQVGNSNGRLFCEQ